MPMDDVSPEEAAMFFHTVEGQPESDDHGCGMGAEYRKGACHRDKAARQNLRRSQHRPRKG